MNINVYGGTLKSHGGIGLCETCKWHHLTQGPSETDTVALCTAGSGHGVPAREVTRPVWKCNEYMSMDTIHEHEFKKNGWVLTNDGHGHIKFVPPEPDK